MKVTFIQHSSFLIETDKEYLLFDYYFGAPLPQLDSDKALYVFASHSHPDHFSAKIFGLPAKMKQIKFILSSDIPDHIIPLECLKDTVLISPYEKEFVGNLVVETLQSTDLGVAFIVTVDGKQIYHAGDLNCWVWDTSPENQNKIMRKQYEDELAQLKDREFFCSFVPLDPRQDNDFDLGMTIFLDAVTSKHVFPMHMWGDYPVIERFREKHPSLADKIKTVKHEGEIFEID